MKRFLLAAPLVAGLALSACATVGPETTAQLVDREWVVQDIAGQPVLAGSSATLMFGRDSRLTGDTSCNSYFADYTADRSTLTIGNAGVTKRACAPAVMNQEQRFLDVFNAVSHYRIDTAGALHLATPTGATITARAAPVTTYRCSDGSTVRASYPTSDTARVTANGQTIDMRIAVSASGARYVSDTWQWWTRGTTEGLLAPLAPGETLASAPGVTCTAR